MQWQVQFLPWAAHMEHSTLRGWLLSDDMRLGKTLVALSKMVESCREDRTEHKKGKGKEKAV